MTPDKPRAIAPFYVMPDDTEGTVFDPYSETFGPILAALQVGDFERAARLVAALTGGGA